MAMTWSLAIEEQFYLLFPFAVFFLPRKWLVVAVFVGIVIAPILREALERMLVDWYSAYVLLPSRMDALMFGIAVALIIRNESAFAIAARYSLVLDIAAVLFLYLILSEYGFSFWPGSVLPPLKQSTFAVMWAIVILRIFTRPASRFNAIWRSALLAKIGLISYALYSRSPLR
jgi:peptidoglycan/LPS O-acetylase OafA/YrhL